LRSVVSSDTNISDSELDHAGDIDYIGKLGNKAFGIQIKPITANSNFGINKNSTFQSSIKKIALQLYKLLNVFCIFAVNIKLK